MRTIPIAAAALLVIASGVASAQTTSPRPPGATAPTATAPAPRPTPNPLKQEEVSQIEGNSVYGGDNEKIGHVSNVLMNPDSKQIDRLVVTSGGFLGMGGHRAAIPVDKFAWDGEKGAFRLPMTTANVKEMPQWAEGAQTTSTGSSTPPRSETPSAGAGSEK